MAVNFYLSVLEEQARCELKDSEARLTPSTSAGKVLLEIQEDVLANFLDDLQEQKNADWTEEKQQMQREICSLKAQLNETQAKHSPPSETNDLKSQLGKISAKLRTAQKEAEQQTAINKDLQTELDQLKGEKEALQAEVQAQKLEFSAERQRLALTKTSVELKLQSDLEIERTQAKKDLEEQKSTINDLHHQLQQIKGEKEVLEKQVQAMRLQLSAECRRVAAAMTNVEVELKGFLDIERAHVQSLHHDLSKMEEALAEQQRRHEDENIKLTTALQEAEEQLKAFRLQWQEEKSSYTAKIKKSRDTHSAQQEKQKTLQKNLTKDLTDQHESDPLLWQEEKSCLLQETQKIRASYVAQLNKQTQVNNSLADALKKAEQQLEVGRLQWQEEKYSHAAQIKKSRDTHFAQLEVQEKFYKDLMAAVKRDLTDKLESDRLLWQQEKSCLLQETEKIRASYVAQLEEQKLGNNTLADALKKAEQQLEGRNIKWQEEKASLFQATESLKQTLQQKQQEWENTESSMRSQLEDLESHIAKKTKKKKWFRKFF